MLLRKPQRFGNQIRDDGHNFQVVSIASRLPLTSKSKKLPGFRCSKMRLISATTNCIVNNEAAAKTKLRFIHQQLSAGTTKPVVQVKSHAPTKCSRCNEKNRPIPGRRKKLLTKKSGTIKPKTCR